MYQAIVLHASEMWTLFLTKKRQQMCENWELHEILNAWTSLIGLQDWNKYSAVQDRVSFQLWMKACHHEHGCSQDIVCSGGGALSEIFITKLRLRLMLPMSLAPRVFRIEKYIFKIIVLFLW
jgi:hypothetical protein